VIELAMMMGFDSSLLNEFDDGFCAKVKR
jgi:hypothetical protein